mmetsp:Transcript_157/g.300  ORF Transcript_157/g.300 Transcript_157/m.300 type:complete len:156 (-) Transcript_157:903-1370(-)
MNPVSRSHASLLSQCGQLRLHVNLHPSSSLASYIHHKRVIKSRNCLWLEVRLVTNSLLTPTPLWFVHRSASVVKRLNGLDLIQNLLACCCQESFVDSFAVYHPLLHAAAPDAAHEFAQIAPCAVDEDSAQRLIQALSRGSRAGADQRPSFPCHSA